MAVIFADAAAEYILTGFPSHRPSYTPLTPKSTKRAVRKTIKKIKFPKKYKWFGTISGPLEERRCNRE